MGLNIFKKFRTSSEEKPALAEDSFDPEKAIRTIISGITKYYFRAKYSNRGSWRADLSNEIESAYDLMKTGIDRRTIHDRVAEELLSDRDVFRKRDILHYILHEAETEYQSRHGREYARLSTSHAYL